MVIDFHFLEGEIDRPLRHLLQELHLGAAMEKYKCSLCFRSFINGRALGGHMRSHMMKHPVPPKPERFRERERASFPSSSSSSEEKGPNLSYGLRENPKRSIRLVDHEFSFAGEDGSVIVQDRESETESSKNPSRNPFLPSRKDRVKQIKEEEEGKKRKLQKLSYPDSFTGSSILETTAEEDLAFSLLMLSEDKWTKQTQKNEEEEDLSFEENDEFKKINKFRSNQTRGKYKCETCEKVFRSYQALGGHRASHKKAKFAPLISRRETEQENAGALMAEEKTHECPVCFRSFFSGQALGGHKRSHGTPAKHSTKLKNSWLDLNMPAPTEEDDEISQIELSALSDAEFSYQR